MKVTMKGTEVTEIAGELEALLRAAAKLYNVAQSKYREMCPKDHAAICTLVEQASAQLYVDTTLGPVPTVEVGIIHKGKREPFFTSPTLPSAGRAN